jgi:prepilin-type N-terminal cleavage/methylation domain-containing protein
MKKGFTLVELLATIVILGIVGLIAIPIGTQMIENAKRRAALVSVRNYMSMVEEAFEKDAIYGKKVLTGAYIANGSYVIDSNGDRTEISVKGSTPSSGTICVDSDKSIDTYSVLIGKYIVTSILGVQKIEKGSSPLSVNCNLKEFTIGFTVSPNEWATSKTVAIAYPTSEGTEKKYQIRKYDFVKEEYVTSELKTYTEPFTVDSLATSQYPTTIIAGLYIEDEPVQTGTFMITTIDTEKPILRTHDVSATTKSITVPFIAQDNESGIASITCQYGTNGSYTKTGKISNSKCIMSGLTKEIEYSYKITVTDNVGLISEIIGTKTTGEFEGIDITANPTGYATKKTITITGIANDAKLQYQLVKNGESVNDDEWIDYSAPFTITENTNIYARLWDEEAKEMIEQSTFTVTTIDTTAPTLILGSPIVTTTTIVIPFETSDSGSGIKTDDEGNVTGITCEYGKNNTYGSNGKIVDDNKCVITGLINDTTYYYKITSTDKTGNSIEQVGNTTSGKATVVFSEDPDADTYATSKDVTVQFTTKNITSPTYYIRSSMNATVGVSVYSCGNSTDPTTCSSSSTKTMNAGYWYKTTNTAPVVTIAENGSIYGLVYDGNDYLTAESFTITTITRNVDNIYYNNSSYTSGDIPVQDAIEQLYEMAFPNS